MRLYKHGKKCSIAFIKQFSKISANLKRHNRVSTLSSKHTYRPKKTRVVAQLFYNTQWYMNMAWEKLTLLRYFHWQYFFLKDNSGAPAAEGRQAEPHTHIRKLKGTHELIFSCVSWLAVLLVGAYARRRRRRRRRWWSRATWRPQLTRKPKRGFSFRGLSL